MRSFKQWRRRHQGRRLVIKRWIYHLQNEMREICCRGLRSPKYAEFDYFTLSIVVQKCAKIYNARAQPLFCSLNLLFGDDLVAPVLPSLFRFRSLFTKSGNFSKLLTGTRTGGWWLTNTSLNTFGIRVRGREKVEKSERIRQQKEEGWVRWKAYNEDKKTNHAPDNQLFRGEYLLVFAFRMSTLSFLFGFCLGKSNHILGVALCVS